MKPATPQISRRVRFRVPLVVRTAAAFLCFAAASATAREPTGAMDAENAQSAGAGGQIRAEAYIEPEAVAFGDTLELRVVVDWTGDYRIENVHPPKDLKAFLIESKSVPETTETTEREGGEGVSGERTGGGEAVRTRGVAGGEWRQTLTLRAIEAGSVEVPPFEVRYRVGADGPIETLVTPARGINVAPAATEARAATGEVEPLAPPMWIPFDWTLRNLLIAAAVVLFVALGIAFWFLVRRIEARREALRPPPPPRPAYIVAYEQLDALERSTYLRDGRFKQFFTELSEIVRRYIQNLYGVPALDWTSYEILDALTQRGDLAQPERERLGRILDTCDLVKFAKWTPPDETGPAGLEEARRFVDATRPRVQVEVA